MLDYSLDELRDAIYTVPDMIQYIVESGYGVEPKWEDDIHFEHGGYDWSVNKSAQGALLSSCPSCGAISTTTRKVTFSGSPATKPKTSRLAVMFSTITASEANL